MAFMTKFFTFTIMLGFWVLLSGMFDAFHFSLGVLCCLLVTHFSHDLLFNGGGVRTGMRDLFGVILYLPYLFKEIVVANLQMTYIVLHPRMLDLIDPSLVRFKTTLKRPISKVTLGQSITLTPATITVSIDDDEFTVYALTRSSAESLPGEMERRVARALERSA
jgi:multicomponent Na+:H+ antiporter subunit E